MRSLSASHFADSEAVSEGVSDFTSDITRPMSRARNSALSIVADGSATTMVDTGYMSLSNKLERIVSMDARHEAENPEFLHSGHDEAAWVNYKREKRKRRGIVRRWVASSFCRLRLMVP